MSFPWPRCRFARTLAAAASLALACVPAPLSFSPDGRFFTYATNGEAAAGPSRLAVVEVATGSVRTLYETDAVIASPVFLGSDRTIAFAERVLPREDGERIELKAAENRIRIAAIDRESGDRSTLVEVLLPLHSRETKRDGEFMFLRLSASRDGRRLVFAVQREDRPPRAVLVDRASGTATSLEGQFLLPILAADGADLAVLAAVASDAGPAPSGAALAVGLGGTLDLSDPDGNEIDTRFGRGAADLPFAIELVDLATGERSVAAADFGDQTPFLVAMSPDGREVAALAEDGLAIFDLRTGRRRSYLAGNKTYAALFEDSGDTLLTAGDEPEGTFYEGCVKRLRRKLGTTERVFGGRGMPRIAAIGTAPGGSAFAALLEIDEELEPLAIVVDPATGSMRPAVRDVEAGRAFLGAWKRTLPEDASKPVLWLFERLERAVAPAPSPAAEDGR